MKADLKGIAEAGVVVAMLGVPPSPGVQLEIGYALAKRKKLVIVTEADDPMPYLIRGVVERESAILVRQPPTPGQNHELGEAISGALRRLHS